MRRRPENSEIMLNASSGRRMAAEAIIMAEKTGVGLDTARDARETRSLLWSRKRVSANAMGEFSSIQLR
jgi:hypothetical protein